MVKYIGNWNAAPLTLVGIGCVDSAKESLSGVALDGGETVRAGVFVDEHLTLDSVASLPADGVAGLGFFDVHRQRISAGGESGGELVCRLQHPGVAGVGGEEHQRSDVADAPIMPGPPPLDRADLFGKVQTVP